MKVKLNDEQNLIVHWDHKHKNIAGQKFTDLEMSFKAITDCNVLVEKNGEVEEISNNSAFCSNKDNFSKATGRKVSMGRALLAPQFKAFVATFIKENSGEDPVSEGNLETEAFKMRERVWEEYKDKCKL